MKRSNGMLSFILVFLTTLSAFAIERRTADVFEMKSRLEGVVSREVRKALETRLHPEDFSVSVNLTMIRDEKPEPAMKKVDQSDQIMPGLMGYVSASTIMNLYEKELMDARGQAKAESFLEDLKDYKVTSAAVYVGLNRDFDEKYRDALKKWLSEKVKKDYGNASTADVTQVSIRPEPIQVPTLAERAEKFQWTFVALVFALLAFLAVLLYQWYRTRLRNAENKHKAMLKQMDLANAKEAEEARKRNLQKELEAEGARREMLEFEKKKFEIQKRIVATLKNLPKPDSALVALLTYEEGGKKVAAIIDATFAIEGHQAINFTIPNVFFNLEIPDLQKRSIQKSFNEYQALETRAQLQILETCFWSLTTIGVLKDYQDQRFFQYLRTIPSKQLPNVLRNTKLDEQLVAVLHLPEEYQRNYIDQLGDDEKVELIQNTFEKERVSRGELMKMNQNVLENYKQAEGEFQVVDGGIELIKNLKAIDEVKIVSRLNSINGHVAGLVRQAYLSLGFINMWRPEAIRHFVENQSSTDLAGLISILPAAKDKIMANASEMVARMLEGDLEMLTVHNAQVPEASIERLRDHLRYLEGQGILSNKNVYDSFETEPEVRLAS